MRHFPANGPIEPGGQMGFELDVGESEPVLCRMPAKVRAILPNGLTVEVEMPPMTPIRLSRLDEEAEPRIEIELLPSAGPPKAVD